MTTAIKPTKITFKKTEAEWYNYHHTLKEIARLREEITNPFDEEINDPTIVKGANSVRQPGDPTGRMATRLNTSKQLNYLTEIVGAIEQVYNALPDNYKSLVRVRYWNKTKKQTWVGISGDLKVSERQAMRWRNEIIQATIEVLGWR
ncbi:transcriptional regulator [Oceanobacillus arenosus]|uniref:Transcriptional regulator n=1 Tax=Oceanobacillus arenosus TaxID=1229153 RepID=A0A3D8PMY4_9BACI|nr:transcriptional regulator [Oceanobacillus arenosus]RDW17032.1 transcriptional regulator [Oceanobacillus arenosus]